MALPKINYPSYKCTVPSSGKIVSYRPFTVADEKLLLTAAQSESIDEMMESTKNLIENCVNGIDDFDSLTTYDIDYLFLQLRIKSISPTAELLFRNMQCEKTGGECDKTMKVSINLEDVTVKQYDQETEKYKDYTPSKKQNVVELTDTIGITLRHPTLKERGLEYFKEDFTEDDFIKSCIVSVYDEEGVYTKGQDFTDEEFDEWYDGLASSAKAKAKEFLENIPELHYETNFVCKECGFTEKMTFNTLEDFFG